MKPPKPKTSSPFKTKSFKKLKDKWYDKLKKDGFEDIEQDEYFLKEHSNRLYYKRTEPMLHQIKADYYYLATQFLNSYEFQSNIDRVIWEYHTNGISIRDIVTTLNKAKIKTNRTDVHSTVVRLRSIMKQMLLTNVESEYEH